MNKKKRKPKQKQPYTRRNMGLFIIKRPGSRTNMIDEMPEHKLQRLRETYREISEYLGENCIPVRYLVSRYNKGLPPEMHVTIRELASLLKEADFKKKQLNISGWYLDVTVARARALLNSWN